MNEEGKSGEKTRVDESEVDSQFVIVEGMEEGVCVADERRKILLL